ncbi:uncharacterized protein BT62DRAFT_1011226 [Guyanagaster necrorhizus]|uniref:Uncharacterized protein n=1 Tax=Guyanagaster necrorhizus TaxID=856835 RepID=A0A9P8ANC0_9AGAR|nr:uncharacterized protein BT62DRAFT_1011226 [Guyanagaster necrorhizus MCA 3950]KAG7441664.1 hypothetical protein BT62DRAFT_1011226 [Guyanagaster necrorhizus MCA 3950]
MTSNCQDPAHRSSIFRIGDARGVDALSANDTETSESNQAIVTLPSPTTISIYKLLAYLPFVMISTREINLAFTAPSLRRFKGTLISPVAGRDNCGHQDKKESTAPFVTWNERTECFPGDFLCTEPGSFDSASLLYLNRPDGAVIISSEHFDPRRVSDTDIGPSVADERSDVMFHRPLGPKGSAAAKDELRHLS